MHREIQRKEPCPTFGEIQGIENSSRNQNINYTDNSVDEEMIGEKMIKREEAPRNSYTC